MVASDFYAVLGREQQTQNAKIKLKIWMGRNMTEVDIAQTLLKMGVPKEDIVLGLHPPYKLPYTGYGVA